MADTAGANLLSAFCYGNNKNMAKRKEALRYVI